MKEEINEQEKNIEKINKTVENLIEISTIECNKETKEYKEEIEKIKNEQEKIEKEFKSFEIDFIIKKFHLKNLKKFK